MDEAQTEEEGRIVTTVNEALSADTALRVTSMTLSGMQLAGIDDLSIREAFPLLVYLDVSHNCLTRFPDSLLGEPPKPSQVQLWALNISHNLVSELPVLSASFPVLGYLNVEGNPLASLTTLVDLVCGELVAPPELVPDRMGGCLAVNGVIRAVQTTSEKQYGASVQRALRRGSEWKPRRQLLDILHSQPDASNHSPEGCNFRLQARQFLTAQLVALTRMRSSRTGTVEFTLKLSKLFWMEPPTYYLQWERVNEASEGEAGAALWTMVRAALRGDMDVRTVATLSAVLLETYQGAVLSAALPSMVRALPTMPLYAFEFIASKLTEVTGDTPDDARCILKYITAATLDPQLAASVHITQHLSLRLQRAAQPPVSQDTLPPKELRVAVLTNATRSLRQIQTCRHMPHSSVPPPRDAPNEPAAPSHAGEPATPLPTPLPTPQYAKFKGTPQTALNQYRERVAKAQELGRTGREERNLTDAVVTLSRAPPPRVLAPVAHSQVTATQSKVLPPRPCSASQLFRFLKRRGLPDSSTPTAVQQALQDDLDDVSTALDVCVSSRPGGLILPSRPSSAWSAEEEDRLLEMSEGLFGDAPAPTPHQLFLLVRNSRPPTAPHDELFRAACAKLASLEDNAAKVGLLQAVQELPHTSEGVPTLPPESPPTPESPSTPEATPWSIPNYLQGPTGLGEKDLRRSHMPKSKSYLSRVGSASLARRVAQFGHIRGGTPNVSHLRQSSDSVLLTTATDTAMHPFTAMALNLTQKRNAAARLKSEMNMSRPTLDFRHDPSVCSATLRTVRRSFTGGSVQNQFVPPEVREQLRRN